LLPTSTLASNKYGSHEHRPFPILLPV